MNLVTFSDHLRVNLLAAGPLAASCSRFSAA
jgi:hypothetical protein